MCLFTSIQEILRLKHLKKLAGTKTQIQSNTDKFIRNEYYFYVIYNPI